MSYPTMRSHFVLAILCVAGVALLAGEGFAQSPLVIHMDDREGSSGGWANVAPSRALARLPSASVSSVEEKRSSDGVTQRILLGGDTYQDRNVINIEVQRGSGRAYSPVKPTERSVRAEMAVAFPGVSMRVQTTPHYNAFGIYGLAFSAGETRQRCAYAWQWLDDDNSAVARKLGGRALWRARICGEGVSHERMAAAFDAIDFGGGVAQTPRSIRRTYRPRPVKVRRRAKIERVRPVQTSAPEVLWQAAPSFGNSEQRYLAPVPNSASSGSSPRLDRTLPAEAYRGPTSR